MDEDIEQALQLDVAAFFPFARIGGSKVSREKEGNFYPVRRGTRLQEEVGILLEQGILAIDSDEDVRSRTYGGFRMSYNPEWYIDLLFGRTEGLDSDRFEFRGQFPIAQTTENSRIYLGIIANLGLTEPEDAPEEDVVRVYVKWNVSLSKFFSGLASGG